MTSPALEEPAFVGQRKKKVDLLVNWKGEQYVECLRELKRKKSKSTRRNWEMGLFKHFILQMSKLSSKRKIWQTANLSGMTHWKFITHWLSSSVWTSVVQRSAFCSVIQEPTTSVHHVPLHLSQKGKGRGSCKRTTHYPSNINSSHHFWSSSLGKNQ